jgi:hypothetical protein
MNSELDPQTVDKGVPMKTAEQHNAPHVGTARAFRGDGSSFLMDDFDAALADARRERHETAEAVRKIRIDLGGTHEISTALLALLKLEERLSR